MTSTSSESGGTDLWTYAQALYARPEVEAACLRLQDEAGLDVNCLLWACWAAAAGYGGVTAAELNLALATSQRWQGEIVVPLRHVRRALKDRAAADDRIAALRQQIKAAELEAERLEQCWLQGLLHRPATTPPSARAARQNLDAYVRAVTALSFLPAAVQKDLAAVVEAAFGAAEEI